LKSYAVTCWSLCFSPDGKLLATASRGDDDFKVWDVATHQLTGTFTNRTQENCSVAFTADGARLLTVATHAYQHTPAEVRLWDVASKTELASVSNLTSWVTRADFSPDGRTVAFGDGRSLVRLWNTQDGSVRILLGHSGMVFCVRFSPDGKILASGDEKGTIVLWDWVAGTPIRILTGHQGPIYGLAVSPDGKWLASASRDHTARLWDIHTGEELARFLGHSGRLWSVDFSPDGQSLVTTSDDETIRFWKVAPRREGEILAHTEGNNFVDYSPDGRFLFVAEANPDRVTLWDTVTGTPTYKLPGRAIAFSPDAKILTLIQETNIVIYETATMRPRGTIQAKPPFDGASISPNGKLLAVRRAGQPVIIDLERRCEVATLDARLDGPQAWKLDWHLIFTPDSKTVICNSGDGFIRLWNPLTGEAVGSFRSDQLRVGAIALSPDGRILASASEATIHLWDLPSRKLLANSDLTGSNGAVYALAFSPDGRTLAAGSYDGPIRLWSISDRHEFGTLKAHISSIWGLAFSPDGRTLASTSYDHTVRLWSAPGFEEIDARP
jgi:WD40 repeat protein